MSRGCDCCAERRNDRHDFRRGGVDVSDFDEEVRFRKAKRRNGKLCKKSKSEEECDYTVVVVLRSWYSEYSEKWQAQVINACHRCGRHKWNTFRTYSTSTKVF